MGEPMPLIEIVEAMNAASLSLRRTWRRTRRPPRCRITVSVANGTPGTSNKATLSVQGVEFRGGTVSGLAPAATTRLRPTLRLVSSVGIETVNSLERLNAVTLTKAGHPATFGRIDNESLCIRRPHWRLETDHAVQEG